MACPSMSLDLNPVQHLFRGILKRSNKNTSIKAELEIYLKKGRMRPVFKIVYLSIYLFLNLKIWNEANTLLVMFHRGVHTSGSSFIYVLLLPVVRPAYFPSIFAKDYPSCHCSLFFFFILSLYCELTVLPNPFGEVWTDCLFHLVKVFRLQIQRVGFSHNDL